MGNVWWRRNYVTVHVSEQLSAHESWPRRYPLTCCGMWLVSRTHVHEGMWGVEVRDAVRWWKGELGGGVGGARRRRRQWEGASKFGQRSPWWVIINLLGMQPVLIVDMLLHGYSGLAARQLALPSESQSAHSCHFCFFIYASIDLPLRILSAWYFIPGLSFGQKSDNISLVVWCCLESTCRRLEIKVSFDIFASYSTRYTDC